ncbi:universal stress protein [Ramlibacter sp. 2FC]|uniref:universal stress protein n=1 Tax=Ramlibacter sp. 2FC TaxID=2502188 RepID=UPI0010F6E028|nr:universal stress protein [Ramlibacter sp. 2FC]
MKQAQPPATPARTERDGDARLVGVVLDGAKPLPPQPDDTWLVAIDGSQHSLRAAAQAAQLAKRGRHCAIHLVHVQPWLSKEAAEIELAQRGWEATAEARALLDRSGIAWRLHVLMGDPAERIAALGAELGCRGIAIGSQGVGATVGLLLGSVAYKLLHLSQTPVLLVR